MEAHEWELEQTRLDHVTTVIDEQLVQAKVDYEQAHAETYAVETNYGANTSINTLEEDDTMETNAEIQQQRNIVARVTETENIMQKAVKTLETLAGNPYFGRMDITEWGDQESLYIGLASLQDEHGDFLINDWRAPISGVFYNGTLGEVSYPTPNGEQTVQLDQKRQFKIADGKIENMFDTDVTIGDDMLQFALGQNNEASMRNIVATIQQEQNQIIRDTTSQLMVVQGVAGSGKTSAILQRIAFLLFHAREALDSDQIVLFSPNRLFSNYIAGVLPSLGERNMRQVTMAEFLSARLQGLAVQSLFDQYEIRHQAAYPLQQQLQVALEDPALVEAMTDYLQAVTGDELTFRDVYLDGDVWWSASDFKTYYQNLPTAYSVMERMQQTQHHFMQRLQEQIQEEKEADWVGDALNQLDEQTYQALLGADDEWDPLSDEDDQYALGEQMAVRYLEKAFQPIDDALYNFQFVDTAHQFADFLTALGQRGFAGLDADAWASKRDRYLQGLEWHRMDYEDATPVLFLRDLMTGEGTNRFMQYIFVDEMQDYSLLQIRYLKHAFPNAKFTLLGDAEQALFRAAQTPEALLADYEQVFKVNDPSLIKLNKSYRSTEEIMNFAKALLPDGDQIMTFKRSGAVPTVTELPDTATVPVTWLQTTIEKMQVQAQTVAILTKTQAEADAVGAALTDVDVANQVLTATDRYQTGTVLIMPVYLAKGLEFDAVIGYDVSAKNYAEAQAVGLLYTIASRAMHQLALVSRGTLAAPLAALPETLLARTPSA